MVYRIDFEDNGALLCQIAGADFLSGDDPYLLINGQRLDVISNQFSFSFGTGDTSKEFFGNGFNPLFKNAVTVDLWDEDGGLAGADDFLGRISVVMNGTEPIGTPFDFTGFTDQGGSKYRFDFTVTNVGVVLTPRKGKIASEDGGVMEGSNKDGTLVGLGGKDIINANNGDDLLDGGGNNDILSGGKGDDLIFGGKDKANDVLSGGAGIDTFVVTRNSGLDTIKDFRMGQDMIGLGGRLSFEDLSFVKSGKNMSIEAGGKQLALVQGVHSPMAASDFTQIDLGNLNSLVKSDVAELIRKPGLAA